MAQAIFRYATPLRTARADAARTMIVSIAGLALICAGQALPF